jgi:DNA-binding NtrC family response regulator
LQPYSNNRLPALTSAHGAGNDFANEREILYKLFFDMKKDVTELKRMFLELLQNPGMAKDHPLINELKESDSYRMKTMDGLQPMLVPQAQASMQPVLLNNEIHEHEVVDESLNIMDKEKELIIKALKKHRSKRKDAALDLGISERTLYRKLKEYDIDE